MANGVVAIEVKRSRGTMVVTATGQTPRGQKYLKQSIPLKVKSPADPDFKGELSAAVSELMHPQPPLL